MRGPRSGAASHIVKLPDAVCTQYPLADALNHPNWSGANSKPTTGSFGLITGKNEEGRIQLAANICSEPTGSAAKQGGRSGRGVPGPRGAGRRAVLAQPRTSSLFSEPLATALSIASSTEAAPAQ